MFNHNLSILFPSVFNNHYLQIYPQNRSFCQITYKHLPIYNTHHSPSVFSSHWKNHHQLSHACRELEQFLPFPKSWHALREFSPLGNHQFQDSLIGIAYWNFILHFCFWLSFLSLWFLSSSVLLSHIQRTFNVVSTEIDSQFYGKLTTMMVRWLLFRNAMEQQCCLLLPLALVESFLLGFISSEL